MKKRVLILSPFYPPFPRPGATKRTENFVRYLPECGWEPIVLTMDWGYGNGDAAKTGGLYFTRNIAYASWKAYHVADVNDKEATWKALLLKRLIAALRKIKTYLLIPDELILWYFWVIPRMRRIVRTARPDVLYTTAPPNSSLLIGVLLKKIFHLPLVCDIRDDWCDNPLMEKKSPFLRTIEKRMERWVVGHADAVVLVTSASRELWARRYPGAAHKFLLVPNGYSEDEYNAVPAHHYPEPAVVHVGSLELNRSPEPLYKALSMLSGPARRIGFYQYGLTLREYRDLAERYGVADLVHFEGTIPASETISRIKGASLLVLFPTQNAPTAIPGKAYEYLRTGKPVLMLSRENATTEFMKGFPQVVSVDPDDAEACAAALRNLGDGLAETRDKRDAPDIAQYDRRNLTKTLALTLDSLLNATARPSVKNKPPSIDAEHP